MEILLATFTTLFSIVNPFGAMPVFLTLTAEDRAQERARTALRACIYMVAILSVAFFGGQYILNFFGINIQHLRIAGGILLMRSAFELLTPGANRDRVGPDALEESKHKDDISFTPLAMPMLSGPGSMAICIGLIRPTYVDKAMTVFGFALVALAAFIILLFSLRLTRVLGKPGMAAMSRIMGFITLAIGVNFLATAISALFPGLTR
ncbi:MarC family protein [Hymenobacter sp. BT770]|jgi:multiple antibiotic resistance protein|uniref:MarC family protein n=1 Tax=Hymenobacter sp. BT770 TaxID=2886942 RepID=UPI001D10D660|nr:MarC family protein [Hymenobacter sp. BT770]MCC3153939.1 MarC family protein [Hymenobacter sp. BT770]MDO3416131.1 MarC family protein [Hymenobacter sp. BT770]